MVRLIVWAGFHFSAASDFILFKDHTCNIDKWAFCWNTHVAEMKNRFQSDRGATEDVEAQTARTAAAF